MFMSPDHTMYYYCKFVFSCSVSEIYVDTVVTSFLLLRITFDSDSLLHFVFH